MSVDASESARLAKLKRENEQLRQIIERADRTMRGRDSVDVKPLDGLRWKGRLIC